jgi:hypothetical protein
MVGRRREWRTDTHQAMGATDGSKRWMWTDRSVPVIARQVDARQDRMHGTACAQRPITLQPSSSL